MAKRLDSPMAARQKNAIGKWAFLIGVILAVLLGFVGSLTAGWIMILAIIGLIVGSLNIAEEDATPFLMSGVVIIIASSLGQDVMDVSRLLNSILQAMLAIFVPATIIVAIKNVFGMAKY